jgi:MFS transporter, TsgA protein
LEIIPENHIKKAAGLVYLTALLAGFAFPLSGIISPQVAGSFGVDTSKVVFIDSLVLVGALAGNILSGKTIKNIGGKKTLTLAVFILFLDQIGIAVQNSLVLYGCLIFLFGFSMGMLIPSVSYIIVAAFSRSGQSDSKLNIMNFFVGIGAFAGSGICGVIVHHTSWRMVYILTGIIFLVIFIVSVSVRVSERTAAAGVVEKREVNSGKAITSGVALIGLALIAYVYTEYIITYWFSPYLQESLHYNIQTVGLTLSFFWLSLACGRYIFGVFLIPKVKDYRFIISISVFTIIGFLIFVSVNSFALIFLSVILLGFSCASIFPSLLGYGMKQAGYISPVTMSFLITCGSLGGGISLMSSGIIGSYLPKIAAIYAGPVCCAGIIIFVLLTIKKTS